MRSYAWPRQEQLGVDARISVEGWNKMEKDGTRNMPNALHHDWHEEMKEKRHINALEILHENY